MTETFHIYGFGVELSQLGDVSLDKLEQLIDMAPIFKSKILKWFKEEKIDKPTLENYFEFDVGFSYIHICFLFECYCFFCL